jgi:predicted amidophosphoribosyltransferase
LELLGPVTRREQDAPRLVPADGGPSLPVWSSAAYSGVVRAAIVDWKRRGRAELDREMLRAVARTAERAAPGLAEALDRLQASMLVVVPIPSRLLARIRRASAGPPALAVAVAEALVGWGLPARPRRVLARRTGRPDQSGLGLHQRAANREHATRVVGRPGAPVLLVDDVLTTGATLLDAERALSRAGAATLGAIVLAVTPAPAGPSRSPGQVS